MPLEMWKNTNLLSLIWKATSIHYFTSFNLVPLVVSGWILLINLFYPSFFSAETSAIISGVWTWPFILTNIVAFPTIMIVFIHGLRLVQYVAGYTKWYTYLQLLYEVFVAGGLNTAAFSTIPGIWSVTRLLFTDRLRYIVAPKPITSE